ncbi:MAG: hypothetical protein QXY75_02955 [Candidatus Bathyarchaeia archaeon]
MMEIREEAKVRTFRITDSTMELLKQHKKRYGKISWDELFRKLITLTPPTKVIAHSLKDLPQCDYRLVSCAKRMEPIKIEECINCTEREVKYVIT